MVSMGFANKADVKKRELKMTPRVSAGVLKN